MKTKDGIIGKLSKKDGWAVAYFNNNINNLTLGYIKKVERFFTEMGVKMCEPQESNRLDGGTKKGNWYV
jgi:hypothetical protein